MRLWRPSWGPERNVSSYRVVSGPLGRFEAVLGAVFDPEPIETSSAGNASLVAWFVVRDLPAA